MRRSRLRIYERSLKISQRVTNRSRIAVTSPGFRPRRAFNQPRSIFDEGRETTNPLARAVSRTSFPSTFPLVASSSFTFSASRPPVNPASFRMGKSLKIFIAPFPFYRVLLSLSLCKSRWKAWKIKSRYCVFPPSSRIPPANSRAVNPGSDENSTLSPYHSESRDFPISAAFPNLTDRSGRESREFYEDASYQTT